MGMVLAGVLAMTPFLHGCATDDGGSSNDNGSQNATEQREQNGSEQQNTGSQGDVVYYGQVMGVNGDEITVVLGDLSAADGEGLQKFEAQEDEVTFNKGDVVIVDESGAVVDDPTVSADQIVVMKDGIFMQMGRPQEVYDDPASLFVAKFLGNPPINVFKGEVRKETLWLGDQAVLSVKGVPDQPVTVGIRPEGFILTENGPFAASLSRVEVMGRDVSVISAHPCSENPSVRSIITAETPVDRDAGSVHFSLKPSKVFLFHRETGARIPFSIS